MATIDYKQKIKDYMNSSEVDTLYKSMLNNLFPELKESEDERIRKELLTFFRESIHGGHILTNKEYDSWIAWLEKQGESSSTIHYWTEEEIEPIISDYLRGAEHYGGMIGRLRCLKPKSLEKQGEPSTILSNSSNIGKVEQKPVISDDALREGIAHFGITQYQIDNWLKKYVDVEKLPFEMKTPEESLGIDSDTYSKIVDECIYGEKKPIYTKEYDFHGIKFIPKFAKGDIIKDKKRGEVSTIEDFSYDTGLYTHTYGQFPITIQNNYEIIEQSAGWSEEDRRMLIGLIDELDAIMNKSTPNEISVYSKYINWLKSLRLQSHWKPSYEHMEYLAKAIVTLGDEGNCKTSSILNDLRFELKKLRGE